MARPREFDEQRVVRLALDVFWHKGYNGASLSDLLVATDLSKSSLYESFGSKRELVVEALHYYGRMLMEGPLAPLCEPQAGRREIEKTLRSAAAMALRPEGQRGCFVNNCMAEIAPHDPLVLEAAQAVKLQLENALTDAVRRGQKAGEISGGESARALARFLVNTLSGINLAAKEKPSKAVLDDILRVAIRALD
ncbi:MAG: TetR/AcrR family transcriptional regulator [Nevskia sp.]